MLLLLAAAPASAALPHIGSSAASFLTPASNNVLVSAGDLCRGCVAPIRYRGIVADLGEVDSGKGDPYCKEKSYQVSRRDYEQADQQGADDHPAAHPCGIAPAGGR